ncbi:MAG: endonuclease/exonuclease/phosphatase family protein [Oligoflexales bacterium]|nr:endonuclease/exonuclease/phosphatase family protein [Oligoflexales bacterium]
MKRFLLKFHSLKFLCLVFELCHACKSQVQSPSPDTPPSISAKPIISTTSSPCKNSEDVYVDSKQLEASYLTPIQSHLKKESPWQLAWNHVQGLTQELKKQEDIVKATSPQTQKLILDLVAKERAIAQIIEEFTDLAKISLRKGSSSSDLLDTVPDKQKKDLEVFLDPVQLSSRVSQLEQFYREQVQNGVNKTKMTEDHSNTGEEVKKDLIIAGVISGEAIVGGLAYYNLRTAGENKLSTIPLNSDAATRFSQQEESLRVLTSNAYAFPDRLGFLHPNVTKSIKDRLRLMGEFVNTQAEKREGAQIAVFQEVWGETNKQRLAEHLKNYPYIYWGDTLGRFGLGIDSGLMIASKIPPSKIGYFSFDNLAAEDALSRKGALMLELPDGKGGYFTLVTTHFQAAPTLGPLSAKTELAKKELQAILQREAQQLAERVAEFNGKRLEQRVVIAGDFNAEFKGDMKALEVIKTELAKKFPVSTYWDQEKVQYKAEEHATYSRDGETAALDHVFGSRVAIENLAVYREAVGGKKGSLIGDDDKAFTDHTPVKAATDLTIKLPEKGSAPAPHVGGIRTTRSKTLNAAVPLLTISAMVASFMTLNQGLNLSQETLCFP